MAQGSLTARIQIVDASGNIVGTETMPMEISSGDLRDVLQSLLEEVRELKELIDLKLNN